MTGLYYAHIRDGKVLDVGRLKNTIVNQGLHMLMHRVTALFSGPIYDVNRTSITGYASWGLVDNENFTGISSMDKLDDHPGWQEVPPGKAFYQPDLTHSNTIVLSGGPTLSNRFTGYRVLSPFSAASSLTSRTDSTQEGGLRAIYTFTARGVFLCDANSVTTDRALFMISQFTNPRTFEPGDELRIKSYATRFTDASSV